MARFSSKKLCEITASLLMAVSTLELGVLIYRTAVDASSDAEYMDFLMAKNKAMSKNNATFQNCSDIAFEQKRADMVPDFSLTEIGLSILTLLMGICLKYGANKKLPALMLPFVVLFMPRLFVPCIYGTILMVLSCANVVGVILGVSFGLLAAQLLWIFIFVHFLDLRTSSVAGGE